MAKRGPGNAHLEGMTVIELFKMLPDDAAAEKWFEDRMWPEDRFCPDCGSTDTVAIESRKPVPDWCRDCRNHYSVPFGAVMQSSKVGLHEWDVAIYMMSTGIEGTSRMKPYSEVGVGQAKAWSLLQRVQKCFDQGESLGLPGLVEVDETYFLGRGKTKHGKKKQHLGQVTLRKASGAGTRARTSKRNGAAVVGKTDKVALHDFVVDWAAPGATVYADVYGAYRGLPWRQGNVHDTITEYVRYRTHVNRMESFWSLLKCGYRASCYRVSERHFGHYIAGFARWRNICDLYTVAQIFTPVRGVVGKRLTYRERYA